MSKSGRLVDDPKTGFPAGIYDLGEGRIAAMDDAGIDVQILSHTVPGTENLEPSLARELSRQTNDAAAAAISKYPDRFLGFAALPMRDPAAAARELERTVKELRFCGAMVHGSSRGHFLDERQFWPIFESASALDVPIYLHPCTPQPAVFDTYYKDYPGLGRAALGFGIEMAVQASRLVVSGVFDEFPKLKIILGHLGEALPFVLWRADDTLSRRSKLRRSFREYFTDHFYITTSGNFSQPALQCAIAELGVGRILFAVDWPFQPNGEAVAFVKAAELTAAEREQIFDTNARSLLRI
jgi:predicted TIM-barrel fold metal-dependent hydrolase